jgi:hypothetical protein
LEFFASSVVSWVGLVAQAVDSSSNVILANIYSIALGTGMKLPPLIDYIGSLLNIESLLSLILLP